MDRVADLAESFYFFSVRMYASTARLSSSDKRVFHDGIFGFPS